jgi:mRNA interferase MazF
MGVFVNGEVITLPFPFTDRSQTKVRPALVLAAPTFLVLSIPKNDELIVCQITTQPSRMEFAIPLFQSDFESGGLRHDSYIRPNHIFTADPAVVISSVGHLKPDKLQEVLTSAIEILRDK